MDSNVARDCKAKNPEACRYHGEVGRARGKKCKSYPYITATARVFYDHAAALRSSIPELSNSASIRRVERLADKMDSKGDSYMRAHFSAQKKTNKPQIQPA